MIKLRLEIQRSILVSHLSGYHIFEGIKRYTGHDLTGKSEDEVREIAKELHVPVDDTMGLGKLIDEIFGEKCEHHLIQPTFLMDYPVEMSPLTKKHRDNPALTERFELSSIKKRWPIVTVS